MDKAPGKDEAPGKDKGEIYVDWDTRGTISEMMRKMGFDKSKGLGKKGDGIRLPVEATVLRKYSELGYLELEQMPPVIPKPRITQPIRQSLPTEISETQTDEEHIYPEKDVSTDVIKKCKMYSLATETIEGLLQNHRNLIERLKRDQERLKEGKTEPLKEDKTKMYIQITIQQCMGLFGRMVSGGFIVASRLTAKVTVYAHHSLIKRREGVGEV